MSEMDKTAENNKTPSPKPLADEHGNLHYLDDELARGGQGIVFRTTDVDLAIKQPLDASGNPDKNANLRDRFQNIRLLPLPPRIPISLPLAILRDEPGYVMRLLNGMTSFEVFEMNGTTKRERREALGGKGTGVSEMARGHFRHGHGVASASLCHNPDRPAAVCSHSRNAPPFLPASMRWDWFMATFHGTMCSSARAILARFG